MSSLGSSVVVVPRAGDASSLRDVCERLSSASSRLDLSSFSDAVAACFGRACQSKEDPRVEDGTILRIIVYSSSRDAHPRALCLEPDDDAQGGDEGDDESRGERVPKL